MGTLWPDPPALPVRKRCESCGTPALVERMVSGHGESCARKLGLITTTPRVKAAPQTGPGLLDQLDGDDHERLDEPDDCCDGWDR